jgi:predicted ester cyclase
MTVEQNKKLIERRLQLWNSGNLDVANEIFDKNFLVHFPEGDERGIEPFRRLYKRFREALPDLKMSYEYIVCDDDNIAYVWRVTGTHRGRMGNIEATGNKISYTGSIFSRIKNGKFAEEWRHADAIGLLRQLDVDVPSDVSQEISLGKDDGRGMTAH